MVAFTKSQIHALSFRQRSIKLHLTSKQLVDNMRFFQYRLPEKKKLYKKAFQFQFNHDGLEAREKKTHRLDESFRLHGVIGHLKFKGP